ncbi:MAG: AI-2E family transporter [Chitinispirillales bacterium]|jgi:predicted PurR-regulated permease PerM|nr:AI-2E family transporter [Chitinispirillales bacterium]
MKKYTVWMVFCLVFFGVLYIGRPLLMPLVLAVFIWYLVNILTDAFASRLPWIKVSLPRSLAFCAALFTITGAIYVALRIIVTNISGVAAAVPVYQYNLEQMSLRLLALVPWGEPFTITKLLAGIDANSITRVVVNEVTNIFSKGTIVAVYLIFLFLEQGSFSGKLKSLFPGDHGWKEILACVSADVRTYIGIKTIVSVVTALLSYAVMKSVGLNFASFWAFLVFLLNYIPTFGSIVATALPTFFALMQYDSLAPFFVVLLGVGALQMIIGNVIEPKFQGDGLNLSPLVILFSLGLWNMIWGIPGMFMCVPLTAVAMIICSHFPQTRRIAVALSRNGSLSRELDRKKTVAEKAGVGDY